MIEFKFLTLALLIKAKTNKKVVVIGSLNSSVFLGLEKTVLRQKLTNGYLLEKEGLRDLSEGTNILSTT